ncbi:S41 family peptidase [Pedobacter sp. MC2016-05]|uniref:S41 family peptidase n=1 Tax=Pedobacter sp. MC2016-05 TaxID=2994474 RepID=UPI0022458400|nr:S41 family peptidase [Pedobacter sp. MC2016-05]
MFTGSSGEVTALAFKGKENTIFIGGNTAGYTTGNVTWPLPFGSLIALPTGYDSDRDGNYYPYIVPDIVISKQDNFENLMSDANIQEAVKFIESETSKN